MPRPRMSPEHRRWLASLIDTYGAEFLVRRIRNGKPRALSGRHKHPDWAKRLRKINFFTDVFRKGTKMFPEFGGLVRVLLRGDRLSADGWNKVNKAIEAVARDRKLDTPTAKREFRTARATFLAWNESGQEELDREIGADGSPIPWPKTLLRLAE